MYRNQLDSVFDINDPGRLCMETFTSGNSRLACSA